MEAVTQKNAALVEETTATLAAVDQKVAALMSVVDMATAGSELARPPVARDGGIVPFCRSEPPSRPAKAE